MLGGAGSRLRESFEVNVLQDTTRDIDDHIGSLMEWIISKNDRQSRSIFEYVQQNSSNKSEQTNREGQIGKLTAVFDSTRRSALQKMVTQSRDIIAKHKIEQNSADLSTTVQKSLAATLMVEAGALGVRILTIIIYAVNEKLCHAKGYSIFTSTVIYRLEHWFLHRF